MIWCGRLGDEGRKCVGVGIVVLDKGQGEKMIWRGRLGDEGRNCVGVGVIALDKLPSVLWCYQSCAQRLFQRLLHA